MLASSAQKKENASIKASRIAARKKKKCWHQMLALKAGAKKTGKASVCLKVAIFTRLTNHVAGFASPAHQADSCATPLLWLAGTGGRAALTAPRDTR